jgi:colicin import membrane protein
MNKNEGQLATIVEESGLEKSKADVLLAIFEDYFRLAGEWERKAKALVVTDESQTAEMKMAREGRLFLKEKRVALEKTRKKLKEQSLREGKAIDGIANVLKSLLVPIEQYLDEQEHFVERREAEKAEVLRLEVEARMEAERQATERWLAAEQEQIRLDNARLREEAEAKEKQMQAERNKAEDEQRKVAEAARAERAMVEAEAAKARRKADADLAAERAEKARIQKMLDEQIECPFCHKKFSLAAKV